MASRAGKERLTGLGRPLGPLIPHPRTCAKRHRGAGQRVRHIAGPIRTLRLSRTTCGLSGGHQVLTPFG